MCTHVCHTLECIGNNTRKRECRTKMKSTHQSLCCCCYWRCNALNPFIVNFVIDILLLHLSRYVLVFLLLLLLLLLLMLLPRVSLRTFTQSCIFLLRCYTQTHAGGDYTQNTIEEKMCVCLRAAPTRLLSFRPGHGTDFRHQIERRILSELLHFLARDVGGYSH